METRSVNLKIEAGKITGIFINSVLDSQYLNLFQNARRGAKRNPLDTEHGIKLIIFGCFLIEAKTNEEIRSILEEECELKPFITALWKALCRKNLIEKIDIISSVATEKQKQIIIGLKPKLKDVFDLRNRLAHFKDEPQQFAEESTLEEVTELLRDVPIPDLNKKLMWEETEKQAEVISIANRWLNDFHRSYSKRKHIKSTKHIPPSDT